MTVVDAHLHLWDLSRFSLSWFRDDLGLPCAASAADFRDVAMVPAEPQHRVVARGASPSGRNPCPTAVGSAVAVQAGDTLAEMEWLLEVAAADPVVRSVVLQYVPGPEGWAGLATSVLHDRVRGIRVATPGGAADLSDLPGLDALCEGAAASARVVEFLVRPAQLDAVARVAARHPHTAVVLCHLGLGAAEATPGWEASLRGVAAEPNAVAKFSGLATSAGSPERLRALATTAVSAFGTERLMFGSDWPMSARVAPYSRLVDHVERAWGGRSDAFWGAVARRTYRI